MPNGALIPIGLMLFFCAFAFAQPIIVPSSIPPNGGLGFSYIATALSLISGIACFIPVGLRFKQNRYDRKHKIYHKKVANVKIARNRQVSSDWRDRLADFDLGRLTAAGWILSLLSVVAFLIVAGIGISSLESAGVKQASRGQSKILGLFGLAVAVTFFMTGKAILDRLKIDIFRD
jgi:hypothetical protein